MDLSSATLRSTRPDLSSATLRSTRPGSSADQRQPLTPPELPEQPPQQPPALPSKGREEGLAGSQQRAPDAPSLNASKYHARRAEPSAAQKQKQEQESPELRSAGIPLQARPGPETPPPRPMSGKLANRQAKPLGWPRHHGRGLSNNTSDSRYGATPSPSTPSHLGPESPDFRFRQPIASQPLACEDGDATRKHGHALSEGAAARSYSLAMWMSPSRAADLTHQAIQGRLIPKPEPARAEASAAAGAEGAAAEVSRCEGCLVEEDTSRGKMDAGLLY